MYGGNPFLKEILAESDKYRQIFCASVLAVHVNTCDFMLVAHNKPIRVKYFIIEWMFRKA